MFDNLFNMIDELNYRKLKKLYENIIELIQDEDLDELKKPLEKAYSVAYKLMTQKVLASLRDNYSETKWQDIERIEKNLSTICHYFYGYSAYSKLMSIDELVSEGNYEDAYNAALYARFDDDTRKKFEKYHLEEPDLYSNANGKLYCCKGFQILVDKYLKSTQIKLASVALKKQCDIEKIIQNQAKATYNSTHCSYNSSDEDDKNDEYSEHLEKCRSNYKEEMQKGNNYSYINPGVALDWYKSAYEWADGKDELEDEKENARSCVVQEYVYYIREHCNYFSHSNEPFVISQCEEGIELCDEALEWTHSCDEEKILSLKRQFEIDLDIARKNL